MGSLIIAAKDTANTLPHISFNATGTEYWSGLHVSELTPEIIADILHFSQTEGYRKGWNEANWTDRNICYRDGPFHPDLLDGAPYQAWVESYDNGYKDRRSNSTYHGC
ncbi:TPA: hypothetical protein I8525_004667 [Aeromonas hydrophila]|nr:hypothetical protein [Aeromonas hydrophila]